MGEGNNMAIAKSNLDAQIDQKVNAYERNPQLMEQRKPLSDDLIGALAMQQMKSEKAKKEQNIRLSMANNPATIVEQYEQDLTRRSQKELTDQTVGIMGQRQKLAQQKQKQLGLPPQQGQGIATPQTPTQYAATGGLMRIPRPNMQNMAQGGILGYQAGGAIEKVKELIADRGGKLTQKEMADVVNMVKQNPEVIAFLKQNQGYISDKENAEIDSAISLQEQESEAPAGAVIPQVAPATSVIAEPPKGAPVVNSGITAATANKGQRPPSVPPAGAAIANSGIAAATAQGQEEDKEKEAGLASIVAGMQQEQDDRNAQSMPVKTPVSSTAGPSGGTQFNNAQMQAAQQKAGVKPTVSTPPAAGAVPPAAGANAGFTVKRKADPNVVNTGLAAIRGVNGTGLTPKLPTGINSTRVSDTLDPAVKTDLERAVKMDPDKEKLSEEGRLDKRYGTEENAKNRETNLAALRALTDFDYSPEKRRSDSISAWMRGVGKGGMGLVYGSMAMANEDSRQKKELYARRLAENNLDDANMKAKTAALDKASMGAGKLYASIVQYKRDAIALYTTISIADLAAYDRQFDREAEREQESIKNNLEALKIEASSEFNKIQAQISLEANKTNKISQIRLGMDWVTKKIETNTKRIKDKYGIALDAAIKASEATKPDGTNEATEKQKALIIKYNAELNYSNHKLGYTGYIDGFGELLLEVGL